MSNSWRSLPRFYGSVPSIKPLNNSNNKKDSFTLPDHSLVSKVSRKEKDKNSLCVIRTYYSHHYGYQWVWTLWCRGRSNSSNAHHTLFIISHQMWLYEASLTSIIFFLPLPYTHIPYTHTHTIHSFSIFAKCPLPYKRAQGGHQELTFDLQKYRQNSNTIQGQKGIRKDLRDSCTDQGKGDQ